MKKISALLILPLIVGLFYFVPMTAAQCVESPNDTWNCTGIDNNGVDTTGNGATDVVNLNGNVINNLVGGLNGITATNVTVNGTGIITGDERGISATGNVTTFSVNINGTTYEGIYVDTGNVNVTGGTINGNTYGIYVDSGDITTTAATVNANNIVGLFANNGSINVYGGSITGDSNGVSAYGNVNITEATIFGTTNNGIFSSGATSVLGGSVTGGNYGIYNAAGTVYIDSADITGVTGSIYFETGDNTMTLVNSVEAPIVTGVMDGGSGTDTAVGVQIGSGNGAHVEYTFTCADFVELCTGAPISATAQGHTYSIQNFEIVTLYIWDPF